MMFMIEAKALKLFEQYVTGWKENNLELIISCLSNGCTIIESHGPMYQGIQAVQRWFALWLAANSRVLHWNITSFYFCDVQQTAFCEWDFSCVSQNQEYTLPGISVVKFSSDKINFIHEYRMLHPAYTWDGNQLQST